MRTFITVLVISLLSFSFLLNDAYAKRFGGGRSFGVSRSANSYSSNNFSRMNPMNQTKSWGSKFLGPIAGLITGGLLASMFMGNGLASGIFTWLIIAIVGLLLVRLLAMRRQPTAQRVFDARPEPNNSNAFFASQPASHHSSQTNYANMQPVGFDAETFLRDAKKQFIRLQAAYDDKNITDLRRFTTPQVFSEIQLQLQERGDKPNQTDVLSLDAILLDASSDNASEDYIASVRFSGTLREDGVNESLNEIWHFRRESHNLEWVVAGIEQQ